MEKKLKLLPPSMPNFISFEQPPGLRQDGMKSFGIPITELNEQEAAEYGEFMKQSFIDHWNKRRTTATDYKL